MVQKPTDGEIFHAALRNITLREARVFVGQRVMLNEPVEKGTDPTAPTVIERGTIGVVKDLRHGSIYVRWDTEPPTEDWFCTGSFFSSWVIAIDLGD